MPEAEQAIYRKRFEAEQTRCRRCGNPRELCSDPQQLWYPQLSECRATREQARALARWNALHKELPFHDGEFGNWAKYRTDETPYGYDEGVTVWVSAVDYGLGGDFLQSATESGDD